MPDTDLLKGCRLTQSFLDLIGITDNLSKRESRRLA
jgi:hypothetical protein